MPGKSEQQPFLEKYSDDSDAGASPREASPSPIARHAPAIRYIPCIIITVVVTSIIWVFTFLVLMPKPPHHAHVHSDPHEAYPHNVTSGARLLECGSNAAEARANNCIYDVLLNSWVPEPCFDKNSLDEYKEDMSWAGFEDEEMTKPVTIEQMGDMKMYYTSIRDHVNHCSIIWRRQFDMLFYEAQALDTVVASPGHTDHCSQYLMDFADMDKSLPTRTFASFAGCWVRD